MKRNRLAACFALVASIPVAAAGTAPTGAPIAPKVVSAARPFPLTDVRLLDGPFPRSFIDPVERPRRAFDVLVDGQRTKTENLPYHPTELLGYEYALPPALVAGKTTVKEKFHAAPDAPTAAAFDVRIVPASQPSFFRETP